MDDPARPGLARRRRAREGQGELPATAVDRRDRAGMARRPVVRPWRRGGRAPRHVSAAGPGLALATAAAARHQLLRRDAAVGRAGGRPSHRDVLPQLHEGPAVARFPAPRSAGTSLAWPPGRARNALTRVFVTFGGAPMFYYVFHLLLLLVLQKLAGRVRRQSRRALRVLFRCPCGSRGSRSCPCSTPPCRAFASFKRTTTQGWARYF